MKVRMLSAHDKYEKGKIYEVDEKSGIYLLTFGKAVRAKNSPFSPEEPKATVKKKKKENDKQG